MTLFWQLYYIALIFSVGVFVGGQWQTYYINKELKKRRDNEKSDQ